MAEKLAGFEISDIEVKEEISSKTGTYGNKVLLVVHGGLQYAAKEFRVTLQSEREKELIKKCQRWSSLQHPNIVRFVGVHKRGPPKPPLLVMEKMNKSLTSLLRHNAITVVIKLTVLLDVSLGLEFLHCQKPPLIHANLSSNVIFLDTNQRAKISGVEGVQIAPNAEKSQATSTLSTLIQQAIPTQATDVLCYGGIALHTITQWKPESGFPSENRQKYDLRRSTAQQYKSYFDKVTDDTKHLKDLVLSCFHNDAEQRPTVSEISRKIKDMAEKKSVYPINPYSENSKEIEKKSHEVKGASNCTDVESNQKNIKDTHESKERQTIQEEQIEQKTEMPCNGPTQQKMDAAALQQLDEVKKERDLYKAENFKMKEQIEEQKHQINQLFQEKNMLEDEVKKLQTELTSADNQIKLISQQKNEQVITKEHQKALQEINQLKCELEQLQKQISNEPIQGRQERDGLELNQVDTRGLQDHSSKDNQGNKSIGGQVPSKEVESASKGKRPSANKLPEENKQGYLPPAQDNLPSDHLEKSPSQVEPTPIEDLPSADKPPTEINNTPKRSADKPPAEVPTTKGSLPPTDEPQPVMKPTEKDKPTVELPLMRIQHPPPYKFSEDGLGPKVIGYNNLGNTCFFNSMLQSVHQTPLLHYVIAGSQKCYRIPGTDAENLEVTVSDKVRATTRQLHSFFSAVSRQKKSISPREVLNSLGRINKRFGCGTQEDSHEVMRSLLSALREEEIKYIKMEIESYYSRSLPLDGESNLIKKACLSKASKGVCEIDQLIGTLLVTTTICHHCHNAFEIEEIYLDLSLPMPSQNTVKEAQQTKTNKRSKTRKKKQRRREQKQGSNEVINEKSTPESSKGAFGFGDGEFKDEFSKTQSYTDSNMQLDDDLHKNRAKFNRYLEVNNLRYSEAFQSGQKTEKYATDLEKCLADFTDLDVLDENNKFICQNCSSRSSEVVERCVSKQILIHRLPPVLILHMKRFSIGHTVTKDNQHVSFSSVLNMAPFCTTECVQKMADKDNKILYGLYAVVVHGGSLHGGHYTACVRRRPPIHEQVQTPKGHSWRYDEGAAHQGQWYYTSDSHVSSQRDFSSIASSQAYLLFYELLPVVN